MAGHSHWHNIKRKKEAQDKKKSAAFSRAAKMIIGAIREGGPNPDTNYRLKVALEYAKNVRMPKDNVERLLKKYSEQGSLDNYQQIIYEVFGPSKLPVLIKVVTDNANRTITELKTALRKTGGMLADKGSLLWQFEQKGKIVVLLSKDDDPEEELLKILDIIEVQDYEPLNNKLVLWVDKERLGAASERLVKGDYKVIESEVEFIYTGGVKYNVDENEVARFLEILQDSCQDIEKMWVAK